MPGAGINPLQTTSVTSHVARNPTAIPTTARWVRTKRSRKTGASQAAAGTIHFPFASRRKGIESSSEPHDSSRLTAGALRRMEAERPGALRSPDTRDSEIPAPRVLRGDLLQDLARLGEASELLLREDQVAVQHDLELSAAALDEGGLDAALLLHLGRQTGGPWKIVSSDAVGDLELPTHGASRVGPITSAHYTAARTSLSVLGT